jgi:hypothetical protein
MSIRVPVHVEECPVQAAISEDPHRDVSAWDGLCWGRLGQEWGQRSESPHGRLLKIISVWPSQVIRAQVLRAKPCAWRSRHGGEGDARC